MTATMTRCLFTAIAALTAALPASAQYSERRELAGSDMPNVDASGRSPKDYRVRAIHTETITRPGGTLHIQLIDPFLAWQVGRNLNFREFRERDGVFSDMGATADSIGNLGGPMPDGTTAKLTLQNHVSCLSCHNIPNGNPGGGMNIAKDSGFGRDTPHYFGAGLVEMVALQTRQKLLDLIDSDGSGWVSVAEATAASAPLTVLPHPSAGASVDYGSAALSGGATGTPGFNNIIRVWYVDGSGVHVPGATQVDGVTSFGYGFEIIAFGWGQGAGRDALNPTLRAFLVDAFGAHGGLQAHDPSTMDDPDGDGVSKITNAGAIQFPATHPAPDQGVEVGGGGNWGGYSLADPDGDGYCTEISEGDLDFAEWFMLNLPAPAFAGTPAEYADGLALMDAMQCTSCHVADWRIEAAGGDLSGDRRFFDLDVSWNDALGRLEGEVVPLYDTLGLGGDLLHQVLAGQFDVEGLFSDLAHHDMGVGFQEIGYDGVINDVWRTPPLWGVGSSFPWGHDGRSLTLEHAILRHDGEGAASKAAYLAASPSERADLVRFLRKLQLYDMESLPTDVDGDGGIAANFVVEGKLTGPERFNAEWLFDDPVQVQGIYVNEDGEISFSWAGTNLEQAYKLELQYRDDNDQEDGDGWPDEWDDAPFVIGWYDGVNNPPWWVDPVSGKN
jgi:hypothetical protein